jgi:actin-related protein 6
MMPANSHLNLAEAIRGWMSNHMLVVNSSFSFAHVIPIMEGKILWNCEMVGHVKICFSAYHPPKHRLNISGKLLPNQLKELVS